jgi:uncharacterized protein with FMN-binding domain
VIYVKKIGVIICALMITTLLGCSTTTKPKVSQGTAQSTTTGAVTNKGTHTTTAKYKDGSYTAFSDKWAKGQESAVVKIRGGKMIYVTLKRLDTKGKEINYKIWTGKKQANGVTYPNLNKFRVDMAKKMLANQTYMVDTIAGATVTTGGWKLAVQRALDKAK